MKQNIFNKLWLRVAMIVAVVTTAFAGTVWAEDNTPTPITVSLAGFSAYNEQTGQIEGQIDGNISFTTTGGSVSGSNLTATTLTLTTANNAKINSVTFHWTSLWVNVNWQAINPENNSVLNSGSFEANMSSENYLEQNPKVSGLDYKKIVFSSSSLSFDYIKVTYTPAEAAHAITYLSNDESKGTVELIGNVIIAKPKPGYGVDDTNPYTIVGNAEIVRTGNNFVVEPSTDCTITINFVAHMGDSSIDFEHNTDYVDYYADWTFQEIEPYRWEISAYNSTYYGKVTASSAYIQTVAKVAFPGTFSCWLNTRSPNSGDTWKVLVSSDDGENKEWTKVDQKTVNSSGWDQFTVDLSGYTNVFVCLEFTGSGATGAVDDIVLTTATATVPVSVNSSGYSTYCNDRALDFRNSSINVYYAIADGMELTYHQIHKVPAGVPVLLQKTGGTYINGEDVPEDVPALIGESADYVSNNVFVRGKDETVTWSSNDMNYILHSGVFYKANGNMVATGRAYIHIPGSAPVGGGVKSFEINLDDPTGIETIDNGQLTMDDEIYNLAGQRLSKMQKGINIVNGKKILK